MNEIYLTNETSGITPAEVEKCMDELLAQYPDLKKVLIIPPDFTRCYSYAGELTQILYKKLSPTATVHVMPALGTHMAMDAEEKEKMFGHVVPEEAFLVHHWQTDTVSIGKVPKEVIEEISGGLYSTDIEVEVNEKLIHGGYDLILSIGQVVPHEVVGMANYSKNIFVGVGGRGSSTNPTCQRHLRYGEGPGCCGLPRKESLRLCPAAFPRRKTPPGVYPDCHHLKG